MNGPARSLTVDGVDVGALAIAFYRSDEGTGPLISIHAAVTQAERVKSWAGPLQIAVEGFRGEVELYSCELISIAYGERGRLNLRLVQPQQGPIVQNAAMLWAVSKARKSSASAIAQEKGEK